MHRRLDVDRLLALGLPPAQEEELRTHLRACPACRDYYDEQVRLQRALRGAEDATREEDDALARRVMHSAGMQAPPALEPRAPDIVERVLWPSSRGVRVASIAGVMVAVFAAGAAVLPLPGGPPAIASVEGRTLRAGDVVEAPAEETRTVAMARGARLTLAASARATVVGADEVLLAMGAVDCDVTPGRGGFLVTTPLARVRVLGTTFRVDHDGARTRVGVTHGRVEVVDVDGRGSLILEAGGAAEVASGEAPRPDVAGAGNAVIAAPDGGAFLDVDAAPWADVWIDGRHVDTTPLAKPLRLPAGEHLLELRNPVSHPHRERVVLKAGETLQRRVQLHAAPTGFLELDAPEAARILVDGRDIGPARRVELVPGPHDVRAEFAGCGPRSHSVAIAEGTTTTHRVESCR